MGPRSKNPHQYKCVSQRDNYQGNHRSQIQSRRRSGALGIGRQGTIHHGVLSMHKGGNGLHSLTRGKTTHQLEELLCLLKGSTRASADNFWELKMNVATFMSLVTVLFGSECDYYKGLRNVYATLELKEVMVQKQSFTAEHCRRIRWAILDDGRAHFNEVKTTLDFQGPDEPTWPQSYLIDILRNIGYVIPVERANFPEEWKRKTRGMVPEQTNSTGGMMVGGIKGQDRMNPMATNISNPPQRKYGHQQQPYGTMGGHPLVPGPPGPWWQNPFQGGQYHGAAYPGAAGYHTGSMHQTRE